MTRDDRVRLGREPLIFDAEGVRLGMHAGDWRAATEQSGRLLTEQGFAREGYERKIIKVIEQYGPYMVMAPHVALLHAAPSAETLRSGLVALTYPDGVGFGLSRFDPVRLIIALATTTPAEHLAVIAALGRILDDEVLVDRLGASPTADALVRALSGRLGSLVAPRRHPE